MTEGRYERTDKGMPQGGNLSPLLSNIMLNELDKELEKRGLQKLGIDKDLARLMSYVGDRYQRVVTKTCVVRVISKEKLSRRGLVSCLDYYNERHALKLC